jgi:hypothetical protein
MRKKELQFNLGHAFTTIVKETSSNTNNTPLTESIQAAAKTS